MSKDLDNTLSSLFDELGNCPTLGDPFREENETIKTIFDEYGVRDEVSEWLNNFIFKTPTVLPLSDAVKIIHAEEFAGATKGNYTAIYMWR